LKMLDAFERGDADILLGTQMVAKGLDFDQVTLVGVINADAGLFLPDFRAAERVFHLIYQVTGRAGRREKPGLAVIQTYNSDDPLIQAATRLDLSQFTNIALAQRHELNYPPFSRLVRILISGIKLETVQVAATRLARQLRQTEDLQILGPSPAPVERIRDRWRFHLIIKCPREKPLLFHRIWHRKIGLQWLERPHGGVRIQVDIDPVGML